MKKHIGFLGAIFLFLFASISYGTVEVSVFNSSFVRGTGEPVTETKTFPGVSGTATIKLYNGGLEDTFSEWVSSSTIKVNGQIAFDSSNFNQNVASLEKEITLNEGQNNIEVLLKSKPGGKLTIQIFQNIEAEAAAVIGPEGGVVEVVDPNSPIFATRVEIPEGALLVSEVVTLSLADIDPGLFPDNLEFINIGIPFKISPDIKLNSIAKIFIPYRDSNNDGYEDSTGIDEMLISVFYTHALDEVLSPTTSMVLYESNILQIPTDHFSVWIPFFKKWKKDSIVYYSTINFPKNDIYSSDDVFNRDLLNALSSWQIQLSQVGITLAKATDPYYANIVFDAGDFCTMKDELDMNDDECTETHGYTDMPLLKNPTGNKFQVRIIFNTHKEAIRDSNDDRLWVADDYNGYGPNDCKTDYDHKIKWPNRNTPPHADTTRQWEYVAFSTVATHEIGHALGLKHEGDFFKDKEETVSIMSSGEIPEPSYTLKPRDIYQIRDLYKYSLLKDDDLDGAPDDMDNCLSKSNSNQIDCDGDGYGNHCDCNADNSAINPGVTEVCNSIDDNCNESVDEGLQLTFYRDADSDNYGVYNNVTMACTQPTGYVTDNRDCNDDDTNINPGAAEICGNNIDENCDGIIETTCPDTTPPSIPTNLTATAVSSSQINLSWNASTDNVDVSGYKVYRNGIFLQNSAAVSFSDTGLSSNTQYCYAVSAYDEVGNASGQSGQVCATTLSAGISSGLVAYYPFNGNANDESGNGNNGTVYGATLTTDRFGNANQAYRFSGTASTYIRVPRSSSLEPVDGLTISLWMLEREDATPGQNNDTVIRKSANCEPGYGFIAPNNLVQALISGTNTCSGNFKIITIDNSSNLNKWAFYTFTYSPSGGLKLFVNGVQQSSTSEGSLSGSWSHSGDLFIGGATVHFGDGGVNGDLDDIRIYNRALSESEIQTLYNEGGTLPPPVVGNSWSLTSITGAPSARAGHTSVWTGTEMIVWGGQQGSTFYNTGGRYNPVTDTWLPTPAAGAPSPRSTHTSVWTGSDMIVWGGATGSNSFTNTGSKYKPSTDSWTAISAANAPIGTSEHEAVWTGSEMIVWGGSPYSTGTTITGGRYNPVTDSWTATSTTNAPVGRWAFTSVWTGTEMIVWGGTSYSGYDKNTGGRYNPSTDSWTATTTTGAPSNRCCHSAVWTGTEMIIWGGSAFSNYYGDGSRYNPSTDTWSAIPATSVVSARSAHSAVWAGSKMIAFGGNNGSAVFNNGGIYDPATGTWTALTNTNAPIARMVHSAIWTGSQMIVWGGEIDMTLANYTNTGGVYTP